MGSAEGEDQRGQHGVPFEEAGTVFLDSDALDGPDLQHSTREPRFRRLGRSADGRIVMVVCTQRGASDGETIRLISARRASRQERAAYVKTED